MLENSQINKNPFSHQPLKDKVAIVGNHYKLITQKQEATSRRTYLIGQGNLLHFDFYPGFAAIFTNGL